MNDPLYLGGKFDVLVVGAGSAGCALAARLSEDPRRRVLLLDAGPDFPPPAGWPPVIASGRSLEAAEYLMLFDGRFTERQDPSFIIRGRVVGGSSAINGSMFLPGLPEDYDAWRSPLWSHEHVAPILRGIESDLDFPEAPIHGRSGPIPVRRHPRASWLAHQSAFFEAAIRIGVAEKEDLSDPAGEGIGPVPLNHVGGRRVSTAMAYLDPIRNRPNLVILPSTRACRVLVEGDRAVGVEASQEGRALTLKSELTVLAAGGLATPNILALSGIGPAGRLAKLGVPVVADLPGIGQNLSDHPYVSIEVPTPERFTLSAHDPPFQAVLVRSMGTGSIRNDMHLFPTFVFEESLRYMAVMQRAVGRGRLDFVSADPSAGPEVHFCYLEEEADRTRFREAVRFLLELLAQPELREAGQGVRDPAPEVAADDAALDRWIDQSLGSAQHSSGTCRMGPASDPGSVVDERGRVHGIRNLLIADLSIAPEVVRAPTNATAIMIGERVAQLNAN